MKTTRRTRFFINAVMTAAVAVALRAIGIWFNAYVTVHAGSEGMGLLSLVMTVYSFAVTVACSGVNLATVRLSATALSSGKPSLSSVMRSAVCYSLLFSVSASVLLLSCSGLIARYLIGDIRVTRSLCALAVSLPAISLSSALSGYFQGVRRVYKNALSSMVEQAVKIGVTSYALLLSSPGDAGSACLAVVGGAAIGEASSFFAEAIFYLFDRSRREGSGECGFLSVARISFPTAVGAYARQGLSSLQHLAIPLCLTLGGLSRDGALSAYGVMNGMALPVVLFPSVVLYAFAGVLIPEVAEAKAQGDGARIGDIGVRVFASSVFFSVFVSSVLSMYSREIAVAVYGRADAADAIRALAPIIPVMYLDSAVDAMLKGLGEQLHSMKINIIDAATGLLSVLVLVPTVGIVGYTAAIYLTEILNATLSISRLLSVAEVRLPIGAIAVPPFAAAVLALGLSSLLPEINASVGIGGRLGFALAVYVAVIAVMQKKRLAVRI